MRAIGGVLLTLVLLYWTYERFVGEGEDPVIRKQSSSDTGTASMLLSGSMAVATVAIIAGALFLAPIAGGPIVDDGRTVALGLGVLVVAHWIIEKEERET